MGARSRSQHPDKYNQQPMKQLKFWQPLNNSNGDTAIWSPTSPQSAPILQTNHVHIWQFTQQQPSTVVKTLHSVLSDRERKRARQYRLPVLQNAAIVRWGMLRYLLATYLDCLPKEMRFSYSEHNKPALSDDTRHNLYFNLSHSENHVLVAISKSTPLGIDIEAIKLIPDMVSVAQRHFSSQEQKSLFQLPANRQTRAFYRCWTRKEAIIKADGRGLAIPLDAFTVTLNSDDDARIIDANPNLFKALYNKWTLHNIPVSTQFAGALAYPHDRQQLHYISVDFS